MAPVRLVCGLPEEPGVFRGLLYTEGNLSSKYVDLKGVFVANREGGSQGGLGKYLGPGRRTPA